MGNAGENHKENMLTLINSHSFIYLSNRFQIIQILRSIKSSWFSHNNEEGVDLIGEMKDKKKIRISELPVTIIKEKSLFSSPKYLRHSNSKNVQNENKNNLFS